jgi:hypothetical protein
LRTGDYARVRSKRDVNEKGAGFLTGRRIRADFSSGQSRNNTTLQVWTVGEGSGIGILFRQACCAAINFRDHDVLSLFQYFSRGPEPGTILRRANDAFLRVIQAQLALKIA